MHITLDSRLIRKGDYFVPVVGDSSDGHRFIESALKNGAAGIIEEQELYKIAKEKLRNINPKIVAVTGSVGKSTTKDFILKLLSTKYKVCNGYLNTKLGLATNIVNEMKNDCEIFVAECGMDRKGELYETGKFLSPDIVVLTNISESHLEKLGSIDGIIEAKAELVQTLKENGVGVFNESNTNVMKVAKKYPPRVQILYSSKISPIIVSNHPDLPDHYKLNLQAAYEVAKYLEIDDELISSEIKKIRSPKGRLNKLMGVNDCIIFDDTYNASPESTVASLIFVDKFAKIKKMNRKIAVLGGMLELGNFEKEGHKRVGDLVSSLNFDEIILVGEVAHNYLYSKNLKNGQYILIENSTLAGELIKSEHALSNTDVLLVKGSQGIRMEKTIERILKEPEKASELLVRQDARWK